MQRNLVYKGVTRGKCLPRSPATASSVRPGAPDRDPHAIMKPRNADCSRRRAPASDLRHATPQALGFRSEPTRACPQSRRAASHPPLPLPRASH
jgi:hypothetical protein